MAAGLGFKDFVTGEVLTAADVDGYLMQGIWVFASAAARDSAVTSPQEGNFAYLKDTNTTTYYTGSAWTNLDTTGMVNPMTTTGDTIYSSSGSTPARLGIGTTGQVLTVSGGVPAWATPSSGSLTLLSTTTLSGTTTTVSGIVGGYNNLMVIVKNINLASNSTPRLNINASTSHTAVNVENTGSSAYADRTNNSNNNLGSTHLAGNTDNIWVMNIYDYTSTSNYKPFSYFGYYFNSSSQGANMTSDGAYTANTAVTSLAVSTSGSVTQNGGTILVYGVK